jgi:RNA polymerase sigma-70 factor, ECF subfamily
VTNSAIALHDPAWQPWAGGSDSPQDVVAVAYAAHADRLLRGLTALTRDASVAEDLVQDAFVRLAVEVRAGRAPDNMGAWLYRVGVNLVTSRGRRMTVARRNLGAQLPAATHPSPEATAIDTEMNGLLRTALAELAATDREALVLAAQGYRGPEIARRIGRTDGATRTLLCRARARMRRRLTALGIGP